MFRVLILLAALLAPLATAPTQDAGPLLSVTGREGHTADPNGSPLVEPTAPAGDTGALVSVTGRDGHNADPNGSPPPLAGAGWEGHTADPDG